MFSPSYSSHSHTQIDFIMDFLFFTKTINTF